MVQIKGMDKPKFCDQCQLSRYFGIAHSHTDKTLNEKWVECSITGKVFRDYNLMLGVHCPAPDDCPIEEINDGTD